PPMRLRRAVATIGLTQMVGYAGSFYMPAPLAAEMGPAVGVSPAFVFMLFSAALLIGAFAGPSLGRFIDRRGAREALVAGSVLLAAGDLGRDPDGGLRKHHRLAAHRMAGGRVRLARGVFRLGRRQSPGLPAAAPQSA